MKDIIGERSWCTCGHNLSVHGDDGFMGCYADDCECTEWRNRALFSKFDERVIRFTFRAPDPSGTGYLYGVFFATNRDDAEKHLPFCGLPWQLIGHDVPHVNKSAVETDGPEE